MLGPNISEQNIALLWKLAILFTSPVSSFSMYSGRMLCDMAQGWNWEHKQGSNQNIGPRKTLAFNLTQFIDVLK